MECVGASMETVEASGKCAWHVLLKEWRTERGLSQRRLAALAGITQAAISGWEKGTFAPRMPELEAVLEALQVSQTQRLHVIRMLDRPRAVARLRQESSASTSALTDLIGSPPHRGDLLRALRRRARRTQEEVARATGVRQTTVARWERAELRPSMEDLHTLCFFLGATEDEIVGFTCGVFGESVLNEVGREDTVETMDSFFTGDFKLPPTFGDLHCLSLLARSWRLSERSPEALKIYMRVCANYSRVLTDVGRYREGGRYAEQALLLAARSPGIRGWHSAIIAQARAECYGGLSPRPQRAQRVLRQWLNADLPTAYHAWALSDFGEYLAMTRHYDEALRASLQACAQSEPLEQPEQWNRKLDHARLLNQAGRSADALKLLERIDRPDDNPWNMAIEELSATRFLSDMGCAREAENRLHGARALVSRHGLVNLRDWAATTLNIRI